METLNEYDVAVENNSFQAYLHNKIIKNVDFDEWLKVIEKTTKKGIDISRVHVVDLPLTNYLKYEIECGYFLSQNVGEKFYMIERKHVRDIIEEFSDFWLFDNSEVVTINYNESGKFLGFDEPIKGDQIKRYIELKDKIKEISTPLNEFLELYSITLNKKDT